MNEPSWNDLERTPREPTKATAFDIVCGRMLTTRDGQEFLNGLRARFFDTLSSATAAEASLRVRAAKQELILELERARDRGMAAMKPAKPD